MTVISDSGPLIRYARMGRLSLLRDVLGDLVLPVAVHHEIVSAGAGLPGATEISTASWIVTQQVREHDMLDQFLAVLDRGEAEVIALANEIAGDVTVVLDDLRARRFAHAHGLSVTGSAGVLIEAKRRRIIPAVAPLLDELLTAGLYLSAVDHRHVLALAEELPR